MTVQFLDISKQKNYKIPKNLIREKLRGKTLYYKGFKDVLTGNKQIEEIMGSSSLQAILVMVVGFFVKSRLDKKRYWLATNEAGLHLGHKNNFSTDLGVFLKEKVTLNDKYFVTAPELAIEIDVKIETSNELDYIFAKSTEMMTFGTQKIVWILTKNKKIVVFDNKNINLIVDWNTDIELMLDFDQQPIIFNLQQLLDEEEIVY
jgi:hypothetical protein